MLHPNPTPCCPCTPHQSAAAATEGRSITPPYPMNRSAPPDICMQASHMHADYSMNEGSSKHGSPAHMSATGLRQTGAAPPAQMAPARLRCLPCPQPPSHTCTASRSVMPSACKRDNMQAVRIKDAHDNALGASRPCADLTQSNNQQSLSLTRPPPIMMMEL